MGTPLKAKGKSRLQALDTSIRVKLGVRLGVEGKLFCLIAFAAVYGLVFINYIDVVSSGFTYGYHMWLALMYFLPFVGFSMFNLKNWGLTVGLGLFASLMNDVFYGLTKYISGTSYDLNRYYSLWLIPQGEKLFTLNLGFTEITVYSWMMALSIYIRIAVVVGLLWYWKRTQIKRASTQLRTPLLFNSK